MPLHGVMVAQTEGRRAKVAAWNVGLTCAPSVRNDLWQRQNGDLPRSLLIACGTDQYLSVILAEIEETKAKVTAYRTD